jgi:hypothetical protein
VGHFKSFHDPVASLIEATDEHAIIYEDAVASKGFPKGITHTISLHFNKH